MKPNKILYLLAIPVLLTVSCKKFLEVKPKGVIIAENLSDFEGVLNKESIVNPFGINSLIIYSTDDINDLSLNPQNQSAAEGNTYFWLEYINNTTIVPDLWADLYTEIANLNVVTEGVLSAKDGTEQQKKQLYAEAMLAKSFNYFHLLSFFSPAYHKSTATTDYGVPVVNTTDVSKPTPERPTLQVAYNQLIDDVVSAIPDLPETNINNTRATKAAAYGMLTRIYMSMGDFVNAEKYADLVLGSGKAKIINYGNYVAGEGLPMTNNSPEELWVRYCVNSPFSCSNELLSKYDLNKDLRIRLLVELKSDKTYQYGGSNYNPNRGITYAEIYLNKAECLARSGDIGGALDIVNNTIRKNRFMPGEYTALIAGTREAALTAVLEERRRELAFKGTRWIDMKRLDKEGKMSVVSRIARDGKTVIAKLMPGSSAYTFQIPLMVQSFNSNMPLNKR